MFSSVIINYLTYIGPPCGCLKLFTVRLDRLALTRGQMKQDCKESDPNVEVFAKFHCRTKRNWQPDDGSLSSGSLLYLAAPFPLFWDLTWLRFVLKIEPKRTFITHSRLPALKFLYFVVSSFDDKTFKTQGRPRYKYPEVLRHVSKIS